MPLLSGRRYYRALFVCRIPNIFKKLVKVKLLLNQRPYYYGRWFWIVHIIFYVTISQLGSKAITALWLERVSCMYVHSWIFQYSCVKLHLKSTTIFTVEDIFEKPAKEIIHVPEVSNSHCIRVGWKRYMKKIVTFTPVISNKKKYTLLGHLQYCKITQKHVNCVETIDGRFTNLT